MPVLLILILLFFNNLLAKPDGSDNLLFVNISPPTGFIQQPFDVLHYDVQLDMTNAPAPDVVGICDIKVAWISTPQGNKFYFHLRDLQIDSIFYQNQPVEASIWWTPDSAIYHWEILPPAGITDDTVIIRIYYHGQMKAEPGAGSWGGVQTSNTAIYAIGVGLNNNYVSCTQHWMPCYDHPSDKATFHGRFKVKKGKSVASNGKLLFEHDSDTTDIFDWQHNFQCSSYLYTFAVDNYSILDITGAKVPVMIFSLPSDTNASKYAYKLVPKMVEAFESRFCIYPYEKVGYVNTDIGSMESQTMINLDVINVIRKAYTGHDSTNATIAHELSHHWFGSYVTCRDFRDAWLNEGFATYCQALWYEYLKGYSAYLNDIYNDINYYITKGINDGILPLYDFPRKAPSSNYPVSIYVKGAAVLSMLRYELGDSLFFGAINDYLNKHAYSTVTTDMLKSDLENFTGRDLTWFFNQWVYGVGWPIINVSVIGSKLSNSDFYSANIHITQNQPSSYGTYTNVPIEMGFRKSDGTYIYKILNLTEVDQTFFIDSLPKFNYPTINKGPSLRALIQVLKINTYVQEQSNPISYFDIYPNPASTEIKVTFSNLSRDMAVPTISIINPLGQIMLENRNNLDFNENFITFNISEFPQGIYFLKLERGTDVELKKFIISR